MAKKNESVLGLVPLSQPSNFGSHSGLVPHKSVRTMTQDDQRVLDELYKEALVMDGIRTKSLFAMDQIAEIEKHGIATFKETVGYILAIKDEACSKEQQAYIDEFCVRGIHALARHMLGVMEVGATNIGIEVHRSLYPIPEPTKPVSLLERLFG